MRNLHSIKSISCLAALLAIALAGCHKVDSSGPTALLGLHLHTFIDTNLVDPVAYSTQWFPDHNGRLEKLSLAQFYVTNVSLRNSATQQWYTLSGSIILKRIQNEEYVIANVPAGTYDDVRFTVGLDNTLNNFLPSYYPNTVYPDTVLSTNEQAVMWGSLSTTFGYTFMNIQGYVDTTAAHTGANAVPFSYQIGGTLDTVAVTMPVLAFTLGANEPQVVQFVHIICDYGKLLQNVNLVTSPNASFYGPGWQQTITNTIQSNIINMYRYECTTPNGDC